MTRTRASCEPRAAGVQGCVTCGDAASWVRVLDVDVQAETARCVDGDGRIEVVVTELVGAVAAGEQLLVHAGIAIHRGSQAASAGQPDARA